MPIPPVLPCCYGDRSAESQSDDDSSSYYSSSEETSSFESGDTIQDKAGDRGIGDNTLLAASPASGRSKTSQDVRLNLARNSRKFRTGLSILSDRSHQTSGAGDELTWWDAAAEKRWREERTRQNIIFGARTLIIVNAVYIALKMYYYIFWPLTRLCSVQDGWMEISARLLLERLFEVVLLFSVFPLLFLCVKRPTPSVYYPVLIGYSVYAIVNIIPPFAPSCYERLQQVMCAADTSRGREYIVDMLLDCSLQGYTYMQLLMAWILLTPVTIPDQRLMHCTWIWLLMYVGISIADGSSNNWRHASQIAIAKVALGEAKNTTLAYWFSDLAADNDKAYSAVYELAICTVFLVGVNCMAILKKWYIEKGQRTKYMTVLKERKASKKMFQVLEYMVPEFVILPMLKTPGAIIARHAKWASILFVQLEDFDEVARRLPLKGFVRVLNRQFTRFDMFCKNKGVTKIETVREEYVCAVGVSPDDDDEAEIYGHGVILARLLNVAIEILRATAKVTVSVKMGMHTGPVVAGVIGQKLPRFRLFGDTMNTAARMMQKGLPGELQFGKETFALLPSQFSATLRGDIEMKGKGQVTTYLLDLPRRSSAEETPMSWMGYTMSSNSTGGLGQTVTSTASTERESTEREREHDRIDRWSTPDIPGLIGKLLQDDGGATDSDDEHEDPVSEADTFEDVLFEIGGQEDPSKPVPTATSDLSLRNYWRFSFSTPAVQGFSQEIEEPFSRWFHEERIMKKLGRRLERQAVFLLFLTAFEVLYIYLSRKLWVSGGSVVSGMHEGHLTVYLSCRATALAVVLLWRYTFRWHVDTGSFRFLKKPVITQQILFASSSVVAVLMFFSYGYLNVIEDDKVRGYLCELMCLPIYTLVVTAHPLRYHHSRLFIILSTVLITVQQFVGFPPALYFSRVGAVLFICNTIFHTYISYTEEATIRTWYKAKYAIDLTQDRVSSILNTLLPPMVLEELRKAPSNRPHTYEKASVVQCDLVGFTALANERQPQEVLTLIDELFGFFDQLTDLHEVYKVETVGDAYIAAQAERPLTARNSPTSVVLFGLDMIQTTKQWSKRKRENVSCRVGVHYGKCIGGIVGTAMQRYHLFGGLLSGVEVLESTAPSGHVQVSQACKDAVEAEAREQGTRSLTGLVSWLRRRRSRNSILALDDSSSEEEEPESDEEESTGSGLISFEARTQEKLLTSKGEVHEYWEVGGPTYIASWRPSQTREAAFANAGNGTSSPVSP
eukprot:TRINITY_DN7201_c0_g1_i2.p1 TRINITY_DN7201_c0_g1~~TRINITY_DN7201_c0_g1_i2.p1  ORF type:complete len:1238 (-),score=225.76 TRINITY_DN7201_c0_g1_i2:347-4060(-)